MPVQRCVLGGAGRSGVTAGETGLFIRGLDKTRLRLGQGARAV
jgi:hypothetical protein